MATLICDLDSLEGNSYFIAARRAAEPSRPPRRESPRFNSYRKSKVAPSGIQCRGNKRSGV